ncbi:MAG: efflux RND transporter periplasmic adaptor subunit [Myxococcaceae bacterium]|nr:efflux RND transporter periplasmic adaptor subunit [Myxococcaceae bacterium]
MLHYLVAIVGVLLVVVALAGIKFLQISHLMAFGAQMEQAGPPPEAVGVAVAQEQTWERTLQAVGTVSSPQTVEIRNEVAGTVKRIAFNSGAEVKAGALLVELDADMERSQLKAARARRDLAKVTLERSRRLMSAGAISRAALDQATSEFTAAQGEVSSLEAQVDKKTIRAPFAGRLGIREVSVGQVLNVGTRITVLDAVGGGFVDFSLPQEDAAKVAPGTPVRVTLRAAPERTLAGEVVATAPTVNPTTRNLGLRARVEGLSNTRSALKPGTFVEVTLVMPQKLTAVVIPATAVVHAPYGDSVFVIEEKKPGTPGLDRTPDGRQVFIARQQFVRLGPPRGDFVAVLQGLKAGVRVVSAGAFKLRNNAPVVIDESPQPKPKLHPTPENR